MMRVALLGALIASLATPVRAQVAGGGTSHATGLRSDSADANPSGVRSAAAVVVPGEPNGVRLVAIPVPAELRGRTGRFTFVRQSSITVVGRLSGLLVAADAQRPIILTVSVPATAPAGHLVVGAMRFSCDAPGCEPVDVPVIVDVQARPALALEPVRPLIGTPAGSRVRADVTLRNAGNSTENVTVAFQMPNDWRSRVVGPMPVRLAAGASALVTVEFTVSDDAGAGDYGIAVRAVSEGGATALAAISVRVGGGQRGAMGWRPMLEANAAVARDDSGRVASAFGADLSGFLFPDVRANGRASIVPGAANLSPLTQRSFGRLGYASNTSFLMLSAPRWDGGVGMLGTSDAGLAGVGLWGVGADARAHTADWRAGLFGVQPQSGGHYLVGDVSHRAGPLWAGIAASDLQDRIGEGRAAQTIAGNLELPWHGGSLVVQAGRRNTDSTSGLGWLTQFAHRAENWSLGVRAAHAPGGTAAFAHATDELQVDGYRKLTKVLSAGAAYWNSRDGGITGLSAFTSDGWSLTQQLTLGRIGSLGLVTHSSQSSGNSSVGSFGNSDREIQATWNVSIAGIQTRFGGSRGTLGRTSRIGESIDLDAHATRTTLFGAASMTSRAGLWQVDVTDERTGAGVGVPTRQLSVAGRVDQVPLVPGRMFLRAEVLAYYLGATASTTLAQVLGIDVKFANSYMLTIDAERNDLQRGRAGTVPWVITAKIRAGVGLPALRSAAFRGIVYRDLNGNGVRDRNEPGMPGAVIQVDGEVLTADASGHFDIGRSRPSHFEVDPRSLPTGWMAGPRPLVPTMSGDLQLAVIPTAPVEVTLRLAATQGIDTANVHFERAVVVLTDSAGRQWTGAPSTRGVMRFDALPPGVYQVSADLSRVGETLVLPAELPVAEVQGGGPQLKVELRVAPRAIRITPPGGRSRGAGDTIRSDRETGSDNAR